jgi:uncharacterized membrane protein YbhN (UPF0104 family)
MPRPHSPSESSSERRLAQHFRPADSSPRPGIRNLLAYAIAIAIILFVARHTSIGALARSLYAANLRLFIPVCAAAFACWFLSETFLFAKLFSYFHGRTTFRELLLPNAAQYFLQIVNAVVAGSAMVFFINRRKGVSWMAGTCTMLFQVFIDFQVLAWMALAATLLVPGFPLSFPWYYPALVLGAIWLVTMFWLRGRPRSRLGRWLYDRPSMASFREARLYHYVALMLIRAPIFVIQGFVLFLEMKSFRVHVPLSDVLAATPAILLLTSLPITPAGLGSEQAVLAIGFAAFAPQSSLLALSLAISGTSILFRVALGLGAAGVFAREVSGSAHALDILHEGGLAEPS